MAEVGTIPRVDALLQANRFADAAKLLKTAVDAGKPDACAELAHWRIAGTIVRRDLPAARRLLLQAAEGGNIDAGLLYANLLASGTGGADDWQEAIQALRGISSQDGRARAQLELLNEMELSPTGCPLEHFQPQQLSRQPEVLVMKGFMTAAECNYISALARPALQPSMVVHPQTGKLVPHPIRSSDGAAFGVYAEDLVVNAINRRIAALTGTATAQGEPLQLLRYRSGNQYRSHLDALPSERNQRVITVLCYLTDDYEGGETVFTRTGLSFRGSAGDALLFHNVTADRRADPLSEHAGLPVVRGEKLVATRWIRERPFLFPPPTPLLQGT